ncbi:MAG: hypothetical protein ABH821_05960 [archaeon]
MENIPEKDLIQKTFLLRKLDLPPKVKLTKRSLLRWLAFSLGLISEQESRTTVLNVLDSLFYYQFSKQVTPSTKDLHSYLKENNVICSEKLVRYHLSRLIDLGLIKRKKRRYVFTSSPMAEPFDLEAAFHHHVGKEINNTLGDVAKVVQKLSQQYKE